MYIRQGRRVCEAHRHVEQGAVRGAFRRLRCHLGARIAHADPYAVLDVRRQHPVAGTGGCRQSWRVGAPRRSSMTFHDTGSA
jgi:hypothetical protein